MIDNRSVFQTIRLACLCRACLCRRSDAFRLLVLFLFFATAKTTVIAQPPVTALAFCPDGSKIVVGSQLGVRIYDGDQNQVGQFETELEFINDIKFSKNGLNVAIVGGSPSESGSVEIFNWPERKLVLRKRISDDVVNSVDWSLDGERLAIAGHDTRCRLLNMETKKIQQSWVEHSRPVRSIRFLSDPNPLASAGYDQTIRVWETDRTKALRSLNNHTAEINAIAVSPIGDQPRLKMMVSVGQDKTVRFWQPVIGRMVRFARLSSIPLSVQWDAEGRFVVVGCEDGKVMVVDSQTVTVESEMQVFDGPIYCVDRHPNKNQFAIGGFKNRWQVITPAPINNGDDD